MKVFTTHVRAGHAPILVREGWSWLGAIFGWLYLLAHRAWIPALLNLALALAVFALNRRFHSPAPGLALFLAQGLFARDLWRWSLGRRGYRHGPIVAATSEDAAFARVVPAIA